MYLSLWRSRSRGSATWPSRLWQKITRFCSDGSLLPPQEPPAQVGEILTHFFVQKTSSALINAYRCETLLNPVKYGAVKLKKRIFDKKHQQRNCSTWEAVWDL